MRIANGREMRVAIVGRSGQLGSDLMSAFADYEPIGMDRRLLDIEFPSTIAMMLSRHRPDLVINTAAFHDTEACEVRPDRAFAVNTIAVDGLAAQCAASGAALLHVGTDYVFDGRATIPYDESAPPNPMSAYGISKYAGELAIRRHLAEAYVIRTSGLFGLHGSSSKGPNFVERILAQLEQGTTIRVVTDVTFSPSYTRHVAAAIRTIVDRNVYGTYHVTNAGYCTWHEFAVEILRQAGGDARVTPVTSDAFPSLARRPAFSALRGDTIERLGLPALPAWQDGLREYLRERDRSRGGISALR